MVAKISGTHRKAFLQVLAETGNYTLAAEQVRVSKDWAFRLRRRDAAFDAACREAVERFRGSGASSLPPLTLHRGERPLHHSAPLSGPPPHPRNSGGGEELVVQPGNRRRVQVKRARPGQWTGETEQRFLAALMACCNVQAAAGHVGKSAFAVYYHRRRDPGFARRWDQAIEIGMCELQSALIQNACHFLNPHDEPPPEHLLDGMSVEHAINIARMNSGRARGSRHS